MSNVSLTPSGYTHPIRWDVVAMALAFTTALAFAAALILTFSVTTNALSPAPDERVQRSATATPGRDERLGAWGPSRGPHVNQSRDERWGLGGRPEAPMSINRASDGGLGAIPRPPCKTGHSSEFT